jgi:hypothetical protein
MAHNKTDDSAADGIRTSASKKGAPQPDPSWNEGPPDDPNSQALEDIIDDLGNTRAHEAAGTGTLPSGFSQWDLTNFGGWTVAHIAAREGHLPKDFTLWELTSRSGVTVAHEAVAEGNLPEDFDRWELADGEGWTIAHAAAVRGLLPKGAVPWELADKNGWTVAHAAARTGRLPEDIPLDVLKLTDGKGRTVAAVIVEWAEKQPSALVTRAKGMLGKSGERRKK